MLTQERLKEALSYNPDTGIFTRVKTGEPVGYTNGRGWLRVKIDYKHYKLHRLAFLYMEGRFPPEEVDHINGVRDDNRWCNLRKATRQQNCFNKRSKGNAQTGYTGVIPSGKGYKARITVGGDSRFSQTFDTPEEAYSQYLEWVREEHGEFSNLIF